MNPMRIFPIRQIRSVLLLVLALLLCGFPAAEASAQLPTDIRAQFGGIEIIGTAYWDTPGSTWFVLIRTPDRVNRLLCHTLQNGTWTQEFQTADSVPQGEGTVRILFSDREKEIIDDQPVIRPVLMITQNGTGEDKSRVIRQYEFLRSASGEWNLVRAFFPDGPLRLEFGDGILSIQFPDGLQSVPWASARDLRGISLAGIPETPDQALQLISEQTKNGLSRQDP
ncbi:hypothetical protein JNO48_04385 [Clostridiales bacterium]|nr:hypothetical protein JNO48_04385 [Clostridiales bacterium]